MRVIAGTARGIRLEAPKGLQTRPTLDRVREALFSILGPRLADGRFLDLFAGTGANGIEALSRGAAWATFVDQAPQALACIARNLEKARVTAQARVLKLTLPAGLAVVAQQETPYDIVFADPPYAFPDYPGLLEQVLARRLLAPGGLIVLEHATGTALGVSPASLSQIRQAVYGDTTLSFFT